MYHVVVFSDWPVSAPEKTELAISAGSSTFPCDKETCGLV